ETFIEPLRGCRRVTIASARVAKLAKAAPLKGAAPYGACGFESRPGHSWKGGIDIGSRHGGSWGADSRAGLEVAGGGAPLHAVGGTSVLHIRRLQRGGNRD